MGLFDAFKKKKPEKSTEDVFSTDRSNNILAKSFRQHNIECEIHDDLIIFEKQQITATTHVSDSTSSPTKVIRLDVKLCIGLGRSIIESCAGFGGDYDQAFASAWDNFLQNSFHVLLGAFLSNEFDDQIHRYQWNISGNMYDVVMGNIGVRGKLPTNVETKWCDQLEELVQNSNLEHETHWVRLYYAQGGGNVYSTEILLDNNVWTDVEETVRTFDFPETESFLSVRIFMVLKSSFDIGRIAMTMAWMAGTEYEDLHERLIETGLTPADADKAEVFIPLAFGRAFLKANFKSKFSDTAIIQKKEDKTFEINLNDEKLFTSALKLAEYIQENGCDNYNLVKELIYQSSEVNAFSNALNEGAKVEDLEKSTFGSPVINLPNYC